MKIEVVRLTSDRATAKWLNMVFMEPSNLLALPEKNRTLHWISELYQRIYDNEVLALMPVVDNVSAGLFWGAPWEGGVYSVHQFIMPKFRGWTGFKLARACVDKAFEILPDSVTHLMGFTPVSNRAGCISASKAKFKDCGIMPCFHDNEDCKILVRYRHG